LPQPCLSTSGVPKCYIASTFSRSRPSAGRRQRRGPWAHHRVAL